jgi:hypothetical protein
VPEPAADALDSPLETEPGQQTWFGPSVRGIGGASVFSDLGHEVPTSLLPSFLTSTLGAPAAALGVIEGVADGLAGAARLAGGALADDPDRRRASAVRGSRLFSFCLGFSESRELSCAHESNRRHPPSP